MADTNKTRVILVDDHESVRQLFSTILETQDDMTIVGQAGDGESAVGLVDRLPADVLVLDLNLPGLSGVRLVKELLKRRPELKILVLTGYGEEGRDAAMQAGAVGYISKIKANTSLPDAIREAAG